MITAAASKPRNRNSGKYSHGHYSALKLLEFFEGLEEGHKRGARQQTLLQTGMIR
jgi:hypothetical protein